MFWMVGSILIGQARYIYRREIMKEIIFSDTSKGYAVEVTFKDGNVNTKYFTAKEFNKATNYFNKMNNSIDENVHKVKSKIAKVIF